MGGIKNQRQHQHQHQHQPDVNWRVVRQGRGVSKGRDRQSTEGLQLMAWGEGYEYSEPAISAKKVCDTFLMLSSSPFTKLSTCARSLFVSVAPRCVAVFVFLYLYSNVSNLLPASICSKRKDRTRSRLCLSGASQQQRQYLLLLHCTYSDCAAVTAKFCKRQPFRSAFLQSFNF